MAGDLPNIFASASGDVEAEILSPTISLSPDTEDQILDGDGTSIVIFEKADDHLTDPEGEAGARIACGTVGPAKP
jgi:Cu-Zn family superoxide dismutase